MRVFGCISPSVVQFPSDFYRLVPEEAQAAVVTLNVRPGRPGEQERALRVLRRATDVLIDEGAESIVVMGVPVAARRGFAAERLALEALTADRGAVPITSSLAASVEAFRHIGVEHPLLVTQYADDVNAQIISYLGDAGLEAAGAVGMGATNSAQVNALSPSDYRALATKALMQHPTADGIFLSARGNLFDLSQEMEAATGLPVLEQTQAAVWWSLRQLNIAPASGMGRLLSTAAGSSD